MKKCFCLAHKPKPKLQAEAHGGSITADFTFGFVLAWNSGTFKLLDASEVVAVPRFSLEQEADHGGFEFSLRFEATGLHVGSGSGAW